MFCLVCSSRSSIIPGRDEDLEKYSEGIIAKIFKFQQNLRIISGMPSWAVETWILNNLQVLIIRSEQPGTLEDDWFTWLELLDGWSSLEWYLIKVYSWANILRICMVANDCLKLLIPMNIRYLVRTTGGLERLEPFERLKIFRINRIKLISWNIHETLLRWMTPKVVGTKYEQSSLTTEYLKLVIRVCIEQLSRSVNCVFIPN